MNYIVKCTQTNECVIKIILNLIQCEYVSIFGDFDNY